MESPFGLLRKARQILSEQNLWKSRRSELTCPNQNITSSVFDQTSKIKFVRKRVERQFSHQCVWVPFRNLWCIQQNQRSALSWSLYQLWETFPSSQVLKCYYKLVSEFFDKRTWSINCQYGFEDLINFKYIFHLQKLLLNKRLVLVNVYRASKSDIMYHFGWHLRRQIL